MICKNKYKILSSSNTILNDNKVVHTILIDIKLQKIEKKNKHLIIKNRILCKSTEDIKMNNSKNAESHKIEQMTIAFLEVHLKALEKDYAAVIK